MRSILLLVSIIISVGVVVAYYADKTVSTKLAQSSNTTGGESITSSRSEPRRVVNAPPPPAAQAPAKPQLPQVITLSPSSRSVTLRDDGTGHFRTDARVEGRRVEFLVDTGATAVVLRASTAAQLGIHPSRNDYTVRVITGNGETRAALVNINMIELGDIVVRDVRALVQQDDSLSMNLLGMTFLSKVKWTHDRGKLIIEQ